MSDQIGALRVGLIPHEGDTITLRHLINLGDTPRQANHARVKVGDKLLHNSRRIADRINGDEDRDELHRARPILLFKQFNCLPHQLRINRADIWAKGIAKIDQPIFARKILLRGGFPILIDQAERTAHARPFQGRWPGIRRGTAAGSEREDQGGGGKSCEFGHGRVSFALLDRGTQAGINRFFGPINMKKIIATVFALFLLWPSVASAQFSDSYNFLKAVRDRDGSKATDLLSKPGTVIVDTRDVSTGETALHIVVKRRDATWLAFLLARGAKPDIRDRDGNTPLIAATQIGFVEAADMLLKRRAQVDATNGQGETALILAVQQRDLAMVRLLLASGANPARTDRAAGMSALDYARRDTRAAVILKLLEETKPAKPAAGPM